MNQPRQPAAQDLEAAAPVRPGCSRAGARPRTAPTAPRRVNPTAAPGAPGPPRPVGKGELRSPTGTAGAPPRHPGQKHALQR